MKDQEKNQPNQNPEVNKEKQIELQILAKNYENLQNQLTAINQQVVELQTVKESVNSYSEVEDNQEILIPLGSNIFTKAKSIKSDLIVNVGSNILVNKKPEDVKTLIDEQIEELNSITQKIEIDLNELSSKLLELQ